MVFELEAIVREKQNQIWDKRPVWLTEKKELYFKKALFNIRNIPALYELAQTPIGMMSILVCLNNAVELGLQIGAHVQPHCYIVPMGNKAVLMPSAEGYRIIATSEPNPVIKDLIIKAVYEGDDFAVSLKEGITKANIAIGAAKRKLVGFVCEIVDMDDKVSGNYISRGDIEEIRQKWSKQPNGSAWTNSFDSMAESKATKRFLKPWAAKKEGLKMALELGDEIKEQGEQEPDNRGIEDRAGDILVDAIPAEPVAVEPVKEKKEEKKEKKKETKKSKDEPEVIF